VSPSLATPVPFTVSRRRQAVAKWVCDQRGWGGVIAGWCWDLWKTFAMAFGYVDVDRDQLFLLPPSLRDWLAEDHLVWFVLEVVERIDTSVLHGRHRNDGVGRAAYDPDMLLALLIYAYCGGVRSSRQIERLCEVDVAYRVICANLVPDHTTIARFRQGHEDHAVELFIEVLMLCAEAGLATVGVVAVDGTKMGADASKKKNRRREWIEADVW
jgi:transposase